MSFISVAKILDWPLALTSYIYCDTGVLQDAAGVSIFLSVGHTSVPQLHSQLKKPHDAKITGIIISCVIWTSMTVSQVSNNNDTLP